MTFKEWTATYCNGMLREGDEVDDRLLRIVAREAWDAATEAAQSKWQPIATAPKDKDILLVGDEGEIAAAGWFETRQGWYVSGVEPERLEFEPTHWMPLPEPPND